MPGVFLAFDRKIMLGTRASKMRTRSFHAFESINYPYVGEVDSRGCLLYTSQGQEKANIYRDALYG